MSSISTSNSTQPILNTDLKSKYEDYKKTHPNATESDFLFENKEVKDPGYVNSDPNWVNLPQNASDKEKSLWDTLKSDEASGCDHAAQFLTGTNYDKFYSDIKNDYENGNVSNDEVKDLFKEFTSLYGSGYKEDQIQSIISKDIENHRFANSDFSTTVRAPYGGEVPDPKLTSEDQLSKDDKTRLNIFKAQYKDNLVYIDPSAEKKNRIDSVTENLVKAGAEGIDNLVNKLNDAEKIMFNDRISKDLSNEEISNKLEAVTTNQKEDFNKIIMNLVNPSDTEIGVLYVQYASMIKSESDNKDAVTALTDRVNTLNNLSREDQKLDKAA